MPTKNYGPHSIIDCMNTNVKFHTITELAYEKCRMKKTLEVYPYLEFGKQLCHPHYCKLVEPYGYKSKKYIQRENQSQDYLVSKSFDLIELLTIHSYADNIEEHKEEHSVKGLQLLGFKEQSLYSVQDYVNFLTQIKKEKNKFTKEDINDDEKDVKSHEKKSEGVEVLDFSSKLIAEINQIEY
ncbi:hypothetical protein C2G38_2181206 [Gigaspora rosea]|uniref:Uncharacterized protein n=1 Tax=Gigaspora rosea TaxID=44941 RepID=A0A397VIH6_9GLOM|nr:hypothetical protein C2G38_2181206 [Gigaspora rosea]